MPSGLDSVLSKGLLRDIPIVNTIVALGRLGVSINDQIFAKKLVRVLSSLSGITVEERASMVERLDKEEGFRHQVGDRLIERSSTELIHMQSQRLSQKYFGPMHSSKSTPTC